MQRIYGRCFDGFQYFQPNTNMCLEVCKIRRQGKQVMPYALSLLPLPKYQGRPILKMRVAESLASFDREKSLKIKKSYLYLKITWY